jgi:hypothetical protein
MGHCRGHRADKTETKNSLNRAASRYTMITSERDTCQLLRMKSWDCEIFQIPFGMAQ